MTDLDLARLRRMQRPGVDGLRYFIEYVWPTVFPGEQFKRTPVASMIADVVATPPRR